MTGNTTGDMDYAGRSWHWRQEVTPTQVVGIVRIDVKVRPADVKAGDDNGWFSTVSGIAGDALAAAKAPRRPGGAGEPCQPGSLVQPAMPAGTQHAGRRAPGGTPGASEYTGQSAAALPGRQICPPQTPTNQSPISQRASGGLSGGDSGLGGGDDSGAGIRRPGATTAAASAATTPAAAASAATLQAAGSGATAIETGASR